MTKIRVVDMFPPEKPGQRPFCEADLSRWTAERNERWYKREPHGRLVQERIDNGRGPDKCGYRARYSINGKMLCAKHAGSVLIKLFLSQPKEKNK